MSFAGVLLGQLFQRIPGGLQVLLARRILVLGGLQQLVILVVKALLKSISKLGSV